MAISPSSSSTTTVMRLYSRDKIETSADSSSRPGGGEEEEDDIEKSPSSTYWSSSQSDSDSSASDVRWQRLVTPLLSSLEKVGSGWALSYNNLSPETSRSAPGLTFLATNIFYAAAGLALTFRYRDYWLGLITEITALASFNFHYYQLESRGQQNSQQVRLALLIDYVMAALSIGTGVLYLLVAVVGSGGGGAMDVVAEAETGSRAAADDALVANFSFSFLQQGAVLQDVLTIFSTACIGLLFLGLSWRSEQGKLYMVFHSLWHLCSAYCAYRAGAIRFSPPTVTTM